MFLFPPPFLSISWRFKRFPVFPLLSCSFQPPLYFSISFFSLGNSGLFFPLSSPSKYRALNPCSYFHIFSFYRFPPWSLSPHPFFSSLKRRLFFFLFLGSQPFPPPRERPTQNTSLFSPPFLPLTSSPLSFFRNPVPLFHLGWLFSIQDHFL